MEDPPRRQDEHRDDRRAAQHRSSCFRGEAWPDGAAEQRVAANHSRHQHPVDVEPPRIEVAAVASARHRHVLPPDLDDRVHPQAPPRSIHALERAPPTPHRRVLRRRHRTPRVIALRDVRPPVMQVVVAANPRRVWIPGRQKTRRGENSIHPSRTREAAMCRVVRQREQHSGRQPGDPHTRQLDRPPRGDHGAGRTGEQQQVVEYRVGHTDRRRGLRRLWRRHRSQLVRLHRFVTRRYAT